jgi:hypothetical protein
MTDSRIRDLAEQAWALSRHDPVSAVEILREWTDLGFDAAFAAIDALLPDDEMMAMEERKMKIYPASSWRNELYPLLVRVLRSAGHEVYDYREDNDFRWSCSTLEEYVRQLELPDPFVAAAFLRDKKALDWCDVLILLMPCGRSAHLEAMYASSIGKPVIVLFDKDEPWELMYLLLAVGPGGVRFVTSIDGLRAALTSLAPQKLRLVEEAAPL